MRVKHPELKDDHLSLEPTLSLHGSIPQFPIRLRDLGLDSVSRINYCALQITFWRVIMLQIVFTLSCWVKISAHYVPSNGRTVRRSSHTRSLSGVSNSRLSLRSFSNGCFIFHNAETLARLKGNITNTGNRMFADPTLFGSQTHRCASPRFCLFLFIYRVYKIPWI
jgi:hypothetical protein